MSLPDVIKTALILQNSARVQCQEMGTGADLVSFHDIVENNYILQQAIRKNSDTDLWIGAVSMGKDV